MTILVWEAVNPFRANVLIYFIAVQYSAVAFIPPEIIPLKWSENLCLPDDFRGMEVAAEYFRSIEINGKVGTIWIKDKWSYVQE